MVDETYFEHGREYYAASDNPVWPHRNREHPSAKPGSQEHLGSLIEDGYVRLMLERLDELEKSTRPSGGVTTTARKDLAAFNALQDVGKLVRYVAGWAIDHEVGLAVENLRFVPLQPSGTKQHPQYLADRAAVDSHDHEKAGALISQNGGGAPFVARKALLNLLQANPGAFPGWLQRQIFEALESLEYGEVRPLLAPVNTGRKRDLSVLRLQLRALAFIAFRRRLGSTKEKSVEQVAGALGVSPHTLLSWDNRLRKEFGELEVERTLNFAENHASWVDDARKKRLRGEIVDDVRIHEAGYDDEALVELAKEYKAALK